MAEDTKPITGVCVIADKEKCPVHYEVIENTTDSQDADMWKDGFFRKVTRYLCFTRAPAQGNIVLTDLTVHKDGDQIPDGYTSITTTSDTKEPILKKKVLIAKFVVAGMVPKAICNIQLTSAKAKTRPFDSSQRAEINGLLLYLKLGSLPGGEAQPVQTDAYGRPLTNNPQGYAYNSPSYYGAPRQTVGGAVAANPQNPLPYQYPPRSGTLKRQPSMIQTNAATERIHSAIEGVPFELHTSLQSSDRTQDVPTLQFPTDEDVFVRYNYDFRTEQQLKQRNSTSP